MERWKRAWFMALGLMVAGGCGGADPEVPSAPPPSSQGQFQTPAATERLFEQWDAVLFDHAQVGYAHTVIQMAEESTDEHPLVKVDHLLKLRVNRFGDGSEPAIQVSAVETLQGQPRYFTLQAMLGQQPLRCTGRVEDGKLTIERQGDSRPAETIALAGEVFGFQGVEFSLRQRPLQPGEKRKLRTIDPVEMAVAENELQATQRETVTLLEGSRDLLRIQLDFHVPGKTNLQYLLWADENGNILKRETVGVGIKQTLIATTKALATRSSDQASFDLGKRSVVRLAKPLDRPHQQSKMVYRVTLRDSNPAKVFATNRLQTVKPIDGHTADVEVTAFDWSTLEGSDRASAAAGPAPAGERVLASDRQPNRLVPSDHPEVVRMAEGVVAAETNPAAICLALEKFVHNSIRKVNYATVLGSAADVVQSMEGDCTEHAVLLAALAKARGIPARAAVGLVYVPGLQGFAFHMWTEVYLSGRWLPLDATLGQGGIGAGHLKLLDTNFAEGDGLTALLPVARVLGQLQIEVLP